MKSPEPSSESARAPKTVLPETVILVVIGGLDLISTLYFLATGQAKEANPLFGALLHQFGHIGFIIGKSAFLAIPLVIAELARKQNPQFVRNALRMAIILYIGLYLISFARSNAWTFAS